MRILYIGLLYNYGKPEEGFSYEHYNIEAGFKDCADRGLFQVGCLYPDSTPKFAETVLDCVLNGGYDAIFHVAFNETLDLPEQAARLARAKDIPIIQWDCDSSWRFQHWILPRKDRVSHFVTTHSATVPWYQQNGMNVVRSQWAGSPLYCPKQKTEPEYDISFIGQKHGRMPDGRFLRAEVINAFMAAGLSVDLFGNYWDGYEKWHGYVVDFDKIINVFHKTKVCLNLSNPWHHGTMPQIKGRHFEIPQAGGFQLCTPADDLASYFIEDKEIVIARSLPELVGKARYYLQHPEEREAIAKAGYERMLREHQWHHRLESLFKEVGIL